jgi:hypothetical protein
MRTTHAIVLLVASLTTISYGDVYIEIAPTSVGPDGMTNGEAAIGVSEAMSVWIWADTPGTSLWSITLGLDGRSEQGILGSGGEYEFDGIGITDPDGFFFGNSLSDGELIDPYTIAGSLVLNLAGVDLPSSINDAVLLYTDFSGTPWTSGAGVMPTVEIDWALNEPQELQTYGWYQTPAPSGAMTIGLGLLMGARRRR